MQATNVIEEELQKLKGYTLGELEEIVKNTLKLRGSVFDTIGNFNDKGCSCYYDYNTSIGVSVIYDFEKQLNLTKTMTLKDTKAIIYSIVWE